MARGQKGFFIEKPWSDDDPGFYHQSKTMGGFFRMEYPFGLK